MRACNKCRHARCGRYRAEISSVLREPPVDEDAGQMGLRSAVALGAGALRGFAASWWKQRLEVSARKSASICRRAARRHRGYAARRAAPWCVLSLANFSYFNDTKPDGSDFSRGWRADDKNAAEVFISRNTIRRIRWPLLWVSPYRRSPAGRRPTRLFAYYGNSPTHRRPAGRARQLRCLADLGGYRSRRPAARPVDATCLQEQSIGPRRAVLTPAAIIGGGAKFAGKRKHHGCRRPPSLRLLPNQGFHRLGVAAGGECAKRQRCLRCPIKARVLELALRGLETQRPRIGFGGRTGGRLRRQPISL